MTRPAPIFGPAGDDAYSHAATAVARAIENDDHSMTVHVLSGIAVTAAAPYVQRDVITRLHTTNTWRTVRYVWLQTIAAAAGLLAAIVYACAAGPWWLALLELLALVAMVRGVSVVGAGARAERAALAALLARKT